MADDIRRKVLNPPSRIRKMIEKLAKSLKRQNIRLKNKV